MSHFTKVATKINSLPALYRALGHLGRQYAIGMSDVPAKVRGYLHQEVDAKVSINMGDYDIGVVLGSDGNYELCADWWGIETTTGRTEREVVDEIARAYALARVTMACEDQGYQIAAPEVAEDGTVTVVAEAWS